MKQKVLGFLETVFATGLFLFVSAMDSSDLTIPAIGFLGSAAGMLVINKIKEMEGAK